MTQSVFFRKCWQSTLTCLLASRSTLMTRGDGCSSPVKCLFPTRKTALGDGLLIICFLIKKEFQRLSRSSGVATHAFDVRSWAKCSTTLQTPSCTGLLRRFRRHSSLAVCPKKRPQCRTCYPSSRRARPSRFLAAGQNKFTGWSHPHGLCCRRDPK